MRKILYLIIFTLILFSCSENPKDRLLSPVDEMKITAKDVNEIVIYDNELKCGGMLPYTSSDNQEFDFEYRDTNENKCIRYSWNGKEVYDYEYKTWQKNWCGFGLIVGKDWTESDKKHDLSPYGFKKLKFKLRGGYLSSGVKLKIIGPKNNKENDVDFIEITNENLTGNWQEFELTITNNLDDINIYIGIVFTATGQQSQGGEVFIDDIKLVK